VDGHPIILHGLARSRETIVLRESPHRSIRALFPKAIHILAIMEP